MKKKKVGIIVCMLLIVATVIPVAGNIKIENASPQMLINTYVDEISPYLVSECKLEIFSKFKEDELFNHRNTLRYFEDYNLSVTQRLFKRAVSGWALIIAC